MRSTSCRLIADRALCSFFTRVLSPLLSSSPPSVRGLTRGADDAIGGQSRTVLTANLPQRTGRNSLLLPPLLTPPLLPGFILSARGVCRVLGHATAMTDKAEVTSWCRPLSRLHREKAPNSLHRSMHSIIMTNLGCVIIWRMLFFTGFMDYTEQGWQRDGL